MRIVHISLHDFRAFPGEFELPLKNGCNLLLHGENGSGKSSLAFALRGFLSLEPTFPRSVDAFVHAFPSPPDPVTGAVPARSADVTLHFDTTKPPEVIRWQHGHLHPLQIGDGTTPASTTQKQRELLTTVSRQSGFFDYRSLLRTSFRLGDGDLGNQLFALFVETLLSGFQPDGGAKTLGQLWAETQAAKPRYRYAGMLRQANRAASLFSTKLAPFLDKVREEANRLLTYFEGHKMEITRLAHPGCSFSNTTKELLGARLELQIRYAGFDVPRHEDFLNEARLTALALSLFLAAVKLADSNPHDPDPLRLLVLDDVLIGLDLSHRFHLLELLRKEFANHQVMLLTHDAVWFDIAKAHTEHWGTWAAFGLHADIAGVGLPDFPRLKGNMSDLLVAQRHLDHNNDLRAAAVYIRVAYETRLRNLCRKQNIAVGYNPDPLEVKTEVLWRGLLRRHAERKKKEHGKRLLDEALIPRISAVRSAVLNRLAHTGSPALTEPDVRAAIKTIQDFQNMNVPLDAP
jgi:energy-coupling factor transporter ATP-binding protein EcfA2